MSNKLTVTKKKMAALGLKKVGRGDYDYIDTSEKNNIKENTEKEIQTLLAYGGTGLGLGYNLRRDDDTKSRLEEDIKK